METCFAVFVDVLELGELVEPTNEKYAERRAATWLYRYCKASSRPARQTCRGGVARQATSLGNREAAPSVASRAATSAWAGWG
jgi:hypothetical protein